MACSRCRSIEAKFDEATARKDLRRWHRKGPLRTTELLLDAITREGVEGATFLDVGGGVGAISHHLMARGARRGVHADASAAYLAASRSEAEARGHAERMRYLEGDFVELASEVEPADLVTLDRVICCYPDMPALVDASASRARRLYGLVLPRVTWYTRLAFRVINLAQALLRDPFRVFLHDTEAVEARVRSHGFEKRHESRTFVWRVQVYARSGSG